ncbi:MAG: hypothetical protein ACRC35_03995 [Angustibacter sp.]
MGSFTQRYLDIDQVDAQATRPVRGRYDISYPLEPVRSGWVFEYQPGRPEEISRGEWTLWDHEGLEVYRELAPHSENAAQATQPNLDHLAEKGLLEALVLPWCLGMSFALDDALWDRLDERHGRLLTSAGKPIFHVTLDEFDRVRQLRTESADGSLLVSWEPVE